MELKPREQVSPPLALPEFTNLVAAAMIHQVPEAQSLVQWDLKLGPHGSLHLLVAIIRSAGERVGGYGFRLNACKLIEQPTLTAASDAVQRQKIDKMNGEIKTLSDGIFHLRAPHTLVTLTAKPKKNSRDADKKYRFWEHDEESLKGAVGLTPLRGQSQSRELESI
ncbi:hypothetical protein AC1031_007941 [Aphanomyces cochlioides]|nr:hypothetical protein AC1031_007941 [Aphanomyces cochlioides]